MTEIILKTNAPDKAAHILKEALATEASRIKYSLNLARKRLCKKSDDKTRLVMFAIKDKVEIIDNALSKCMVPECVFRGKCYEIDPCVGGK